MGGKENTTGDKIGLKYYSGITLFIIQSYEKLLEIRLITQHTIENQSPQTPNWSKY